MQQGPDTGPRDASDPPDDPSDMELVEERLSRSHYYKRATGRQSEAAGLME